MDSSRLNAEVLCPRCQNKDPDKMWDDNLAWGCNVCGYFGNEDGGSMIFAKDIPGLPTTVKEVDEKAGFTRLDYMPRLIPDGTQPREIPTYQPQKDDRNELW